jgi:hypothetical protein
VHQIPWLGQYHRCPKLIEFQAPMHSSTASVCSKIKR